MRPEDELRAAWERLGAPDPAARADDLAAADAATRAAVDWLARAYRSLEAPAPHADALYAPGTPDTPGATLRAAYETLPIPPCPLPARAPRRWAATRRAATVVVILAAAAALALLLRAALEPAAPEPAPERVAQAPDAPAEPPSAPPIQPVREPTPPTVASASALAPGIPAQVTPNGLELRSGPVRLLLLAPTSDPDPSAR